MNMRRITPRGYALSLSLLTVITAGPLQGQWVEPPRQGWAAVTFYYLDTHEQFGVTGDSRPIELEGHAQTASTFFTVAMGVVPGVDVWVQPSFHRLRFDDRDGRRTSTGFGDTRIFVRATPLRLIGSDFPFALRAGVKLPASELDVGTNIIPLSDGQRDYEVLAEVGHSFWPRPLYAAVAGGYRWREPDGRDDFGDERFFSATFGGSGSLLGFKLLMEGSYSGTPRSGAFIDVGKEREMLRFHPSVLVVAGPGQVELGARLPIAGKNLPAGSDFTIGYFTRFGFGSAP